MLMGEHIYKEDDDNDFGHLESAVTLEYLNSCPGRVILKHSSSEKRTESPEHEKGVVCKQSSGLRTRILKQTFKGQVEEKKLTKTIRKGKPAELRENHITKGKGVEFQERGNDH